MDVEKEVQRLRDRYPGREIRLEPPDNPTEIICEQIEPTSEHPEYSVAMAVIEQSPLHHHKKITETYDVDKNGPLILNLANVEIELVSGDTYVIEPATPHSARCKEGQEPVWVKVYSRPPFDPTDYYIDKE